MSDLEQRLRNTSIRFAAESEDDAKIRRNRVCIEAADRLRQYREALERIANARSAMEGGSIAECRRFARTALKETTDVD